MARPRIPADALIGDRFVKSSKGRTAPELVAEKVVVLGKLEIGKKENDADVIFHEKTKLDEVNIEISEIEATVGKPIDEIVPSRIDTRIDTVTIQEEANKIAKKIVKAQSKQKVKTSSGRVFTLFDYSSDVVENQEESVTAGIWSGGIGTLTSFFSSSAQTATQKKYYYEIFQSASSAQGSEPQFAVAYGHIAGSGSAITNADGVTKAIYSQYKLLMLEPGDDAFTVGGKDLRQIYVLNFNRARMKEKIDPGNLELCIAHLSGSTFVNQVHTGSNVKLSGDSKYIKLIDDSGDSTQTVTVGSGTGNIYTMVSGSIANGIYNSSAPHNYGLIYPELGTIILDADSLNNSCSFNTVTGSNVAGDNAFKIFTAISGAAVIDGSNGGFDARNLEKITATHYFVRIKNGEYNFSNNPTWVTGSVGTFKHSTFVGDPKTYVTTVGLYNERQELLAVAKLSQPILKSFSNEANIKIKLQF